MGGNKPRQQRKLGHDWPEKELWWTGRRACLPMKAYCSLGCVAKVWPAAGRKWVLPLHSTGETAAVPATGARTARKKEKPTLAQVQSRATKHGLGWQHMIYKDRLSELCLFSLEKKRWDAGCQAAVIHCLNGRVAEKMEIWVNKPELQQREFPLDIGENLLLMRVVQPWDPALTDQEESILTSFPNLPGLYKALNDLMSISWLEQRVGLDTSRGQFPNRSLYDSMTNLYHLYIFSH